MSQKKCEDSMTYITLSSMPYDDWIITYSHYSIVSASYNQKCWVNLGLWSRLRENIFYYYKISPEKLQEEIRHFAWFGAICTI